jgi:SAM-dependent methyltransferase
MDDEVARTLAISELRERFRQYSRQAYRRAPLPPKPGILDIGCGRGGGTLELARLSDGEIVACDLESEALVELRRGISAEGLEPRVVVLRCDFLDAPFSEASFDCLWEEGVLHMVDLERGLAQCRRLLRAGGVLVSCEALCWFEQVEREIADAGLVAVDRVDWEEGCWHRQYFGPLERRLEVLKRRHPELETGHPAIALYEEQLQWAREHAAETDCAHRIFRLAK